MSEIKNPFLGSLDENDNSIQSEANDDVHNSQTVPVSRNNDVRKLSNKEGVSSNTTTSVHPKSFDESGVMEIKKDSNFLKNIIITLIILLILAILGLALWNLFNKNKAKPANNEITKQDERTIMETPSFEMSGNNFRASSVVVE
jgi:preprotein translocase subunit SecG